MNFVGGGAVAFGPKPAPIASVNSSLIPNQIQTVAPNSSVRGPVNIVSSFPNGWTTLAPMAFSYGPHIQYVVPSGDRPSGGSQITILGYGFGSDTSHISVKIGGQAAEVLNSQPFALLHFPIYTLTVKAPQGGAGSAADLVVSTSTGDFTLPGVFHYWQDVQEFYSWQLHRDSARLEPESVISAGSHGSTHPGIFPQHSAVSRTHCYWRLASLYGFDSRRLATGYSKC